MFLNCVGSISWWMHFAELAEQSIQLNHRFQKQSGLSQYRIPGPNGPILLSVPTEKASRKGPYDQVKISYAENWIADHWRSLEAAYKKSPFFEYYDFRLRPIYDARPELLLDLNKALFEQLRNSLKLKNEVTWEKDQAIIFEETANLEHQSYPQVFDDRLGFVPNCSIYDLLFNLGPESADYLNGDQSMEA